MIYRFITFVVFCCLICCPNCALSQPKAYGALCPEKFGALANGTHDDTHAIQTAIDSLVKIGGGTVYLSTGTYLVKSIRLGPKVSLVGNGNGATVIKQAKGQIEHCIIVKNIAAALKITDLTVLGENNNSGIYFEESGGAGENHHYLYANTSQWNKSQAYKWIVIDNVCVYRFETGLDICKWGFNINISNSTFSHNGNGVIMKCTDSFMYNCFVTNNRKNGLVVVGGADKISNVKSIFNGRDSAKNYGAIVIKASGCQIMNCETQDNYGKGFIVEGMYNSFTNCMSNTDGYSKDPYQYDPAVKACGFMIKNLYNTFSNCVVMNYNEKYGAVYHSPVIVDEPMSYYYPNIFEDIKVLNTANRLMFNEPFRNVQTLASKNQIENLNIGLIEGSNYFVKTHPKDNTLKVKDLHLCSLQLLVDFKCDGNGGKIIEINGEDTLSVNVEQSSLVLYWQGRKVEELVLDNDMVMNKDNLRFILSFSRYEGSRYVQMLMYEKTENRGWIKKTITGENDIPKEKIENAIIKIGDRQLSVKRVVLTHSPFPESVFLPSSNINRVYDSSVVFVDADSM